MNVSEKHRHLSEVKRRLKQGKKWQKFDEADAHPEDIHTLEDLAKFSFMTKEELRDSRLNILSWDATPPYRCHRWFASTPRLARRDTPTMLALPGTTAIPGLSRWPASTGRAPTRLSSWASA